MSNIVTESAFNLYKFTAVAASELKNRVCLYITDTVAVYHKHLIGVMMGYYCANMCVCVELALNYWPTDFYAF